MTVPGEANHLDLLRIVSLLNRVFSPGLSFLFLPGDVADAGSAAQFRVVREALDPVTLPWCCIVGDHDVHERSFANFQQFMSPETRFHFQLGAVQFFALNAFDIPDPASFILLSAQLEWLRAGLARMPPGHTAVLLLHCYPTDLRQSGGDLHDLLARFPVRLVSMGHTHYNEVSNDGRTVYTTTHSTGEVEEGPVGFSITTLDGPVVSWKFLPLGSLPAVLITSPADERFLTTVCATPASGTPSLTVRAIPWGIAPFRSVRAGLGGRRVHLLQLPGSIVWQGDLPTTGLPAGVHPLTVTAIDDAGSEASDSIRLRLGEARNTPHRHERDQGNALAAWPERGLLSTQLGPNKHGRKW